METLLRRQATEFMPNSMTQPKVMVAISGKPTTTCGVEKMSKKKCKSPKSPKYAAICCVPILKTSGINCVPFQKIPLV